MRYVYLSDPHLVWETPVARMDDIVATQEEKWTFILDYCREIKAPLIVSGDLFDTPRSWKILHWFSLLLRKYSDVKIYTILGQHDLYFRNSIVQETSIGILKVWNGVQILGSTPTQISPDYKIHIYGCSYGDEVPEIIDPTANNILVIHRMITDRPMWVGQTDYTDASYFLAKEAKGFDVVLCGDAHRKFLIQSSSGKIICNTGPLLRLEASQEMLEHKPCIFVYDSDLHKIEEIEVPHRPSEDVLSTTHIERKKEFEVMLTSFIDTVKNTDIDHGMSFQDNLWTFVKANGIGESVQNILTEVMEENDGKY